MFGLRGSCRSTQGVAGAAMAVGWLVAASACSLGSPHTQPIVIPTTVSLSYLAVQNYAAPVVGKPYAVQLSAEGGKPPYEWSLASGALPTGLTLSPVGLISGTPSGTGNYAFSVKVQDSTGSTSGGQLFGPLNTSGTITFAIAQPLTLPTYGQNENLGYEPFVQGGTPPYAFSIDGLPAGVTYDPVTGTIMGTPTTAGVVTLTISLKDANGNVAQGTPTSASLVVNAPLVIGGDNAGASSGEFDGTYSVALSGTETCSFPNGQGGTTTSSAPYSAPLTLDVQNNYIVGSQGGQLEDTGAGISHITTFTYSAAGITIQMTGSFRTGTALGKTCSGTWTISGGALTNPGGGGTCSATGTWQGSGG